jgi:hypothetical protein
MPIVFTRNNASTSPPVSGFVPYTGATQDVDLGGNDLHANYIVAAEQVSALFLMARALFLQSGNNTTDLITLEPEATLTASYDVKVQNKSGTLALLSDIVSGGLTDADNGLTNNAGVAQLGGQLEHNTAIDLDANILNIIDTAGGGNGVNISGSYFSVNSTVTGKFSGIGNGGGQIELFFENTVSFLFSRIIIDTNGIEVTDTLHNIGMFGNAYYGGSKNDLYYAQQKFVTDLTDPAPKKLANADFTARNAGTTILSYTPTPTLGTYQISGYLFFTTTGGTDTVDFEVAYEDQHGNVHTIIVATLVSPTSEVAIPTFNIRAQNSAITINAVHTGGGGSVYDCGATITQVG